MKLPAPAIFQYSETAFLVQFQTGFDVEANKAIHQIASWLVQNPLQGQVEVVPAYDSLLISFSPAQNALGDNEIGIAKVEQRMMQALAGIALANDKLTSPPLQIPVYYETAAGADLHAMANLTGLSIEEIIHIHSGRLYHVFMLGFLPGFSYMGVVDNRIALPRKNKPVQVKAGAVGIAGFQTGIYPLRSPGGWHILGHTPLKMFDALRTPAVLVHPGMQVQFVPIGLSEYKSLMQA